MSLAPDRPCQPRLLVFSSSLLVCTALLSGLSVCLISTPVRAQDKADKANKADKAEKETEKTEKKDDESSEDIDLTTEDGLDLKATYFPGTKGKESIPVILLHGFDKGKGSRKDFTQEQGLAPYLQEKLGCAVIVPDLRGYGDSVKFKKSGRQTDDPKDEKRAEELKKKLQTQTLAMVTKDLRAVKDFLWKQNNEKALNLDKLTVIGAEEGAALALSYAAYDAIGYERNEIKVGSLKLGKFVKVLVLISPDTNVPLLKTAQVMKVPDVCEELQVMIVVGNKSKKHFEEAQKLQQLVQAARGLRRPPEDRVADPLLPPQDRHLVAGLQAS